MKKLFILTILSLLIHQFTFAQTEKGKFEIGSAVNMDLSYNSNANKGDIDSRFDQQNNSISFGVQPRVGYFLFNGFVAGVGLDYHTEVGTLDENHDSLRFKLKNRSYQIAVSPYVKYYFGSGKLKPFVGASFSYGKNYGKSESIPTYLGDDLTEDSKLDTHTHKSDYTSYSIFPGVSYFINDNVSLDLMLKYIHTKYSYKDYYIDTEQENGFDVNVGISIFL